MDYINNINNSYETNYNNNNNTPKKHKVNWQKIRCGKKNNQTQYTYVWSESSIFCRAWNATRCVCIETTFRWRRGDGEVGQRGWEKLVLETTKTNLLTYHQQKLKMRFYSQPELVTKRNKRRAFERTQIISSPNLRWSAFNSMYLVGLSYSKSHQIFFSLSILSSLI